MNKELCNWNQQIFVMMPYEKWKQSARFFFPCVLSLFYFLALMYLVPSWTVGLVCGKLEAFLDNHGVSSSSAVCVDMLEWCWLGNVQVIEAPTCCPQTHAAGGSHGAFHRQHRLQDRRRHREAGGHGEGQAKEERCVGKAVGWSDRSKKLTLCGLVTTCMSSFLLALGPMAWLGRIEGVVVKRRWVLWQWASDFN